MEMSDDGEANHDSFRGGGGTNRICKKEHENGKDKG